jgi:hypothetical protein
LHYLIFFIIHDTLHTHWFRYPSPRFYIFLRLFIFMTRTYRYASRRSVGVHMSDPYLSGYSHVIL